MKINWKKKERDKLRSTKEIRDREKRSRQNKPSSSYTLISPPLPGVSSSSPPLYPPPMKPTSGDVQPSGTAPFGAHTAVVRWKTVRLSVAFFGVILGLLVLYNSAINPFNILPVSYSYRAFRSYSSLRNPLLVSFYTFPSFIHISW